MGPSGTRLAIVGVVQRWTNIRLVQEKGGHGSAECFGDRLVPGQAHREPDGRSTAIGARGGCDEGCRGSSMLTGGGGPPRDGGDKTRPLPT